MAQWDSLAALCLSGFTKLRGSLRARTEGQTTSILRTPVYATPPDLATLGLQKYNVQNNDEVEGFLLRHLGSGPRWNSDSSQIKAGSRESPPRLADQGTGLCSKPTEES